jgi:subtilisin family serine protease
MKRSGIFKNRAVFPLLGIILLAAALVAVNGFAPSGLLTLVSDFKGSHAAADTIQGDLLTHAEAEGAGDSGKGSLLSSPENPYIDENNSGEECEIFFGQCYEELNYYLKKKADALRRQRKFMEDRGIDWNSNRSPASFGSGGGGGGGFSPPAESSPPSQPQKTGEDGKPDYSGKEGEEDVIEPEKKVHPELLALLSRPHDGSQTSEMPQDEEKGVRVIVEAGSESGLAEIANLARALGGKEITVLETGDLVTLEIPAGKLLELAGDNSVDFIFPEREIKLLLDRSAEQINSQSFRERGFTGRGIKVAVVDTGIDGSHEMLEGKIILEKNFSSEAGVKDLHGHGTHAAGIIAGSVRQGGAFDGIAPDAVLINAKALNADGYGTNISVISAINWAVDPDNDTSTDDGADVINISLGGAYYEPDSPLERAVREAVERGVLVVASAGNCSAENPSPRCNGFIGVTTPGSSPYALTVGAVDANSAWADFSSGEIITGTGIKPDVAAPGVGITSAWVNNSYASKSGTSMAAPFISGVGALLLEANPSLTPLEARALIEETTFDLGAKGKDIKYGAGLVDCQRIISSDAFVTPEFDLEVFSSSNIRTGISQQVQGRLKVHNAKEDEIKVIEVLSEPWIYHDLENNPVAAGESTYINYEFSPRSIGLGQHTAEILIVTKDTLITHTLNIEVVEGSIDQNIDKNISVQVGTIGAIYVNNTYVLNSAPPKVFGGENIEFRIYLFNGTGPSRQYSATLKLIGPSGSEICDFGYQTEYVNKGFSKQLYYYYDLPVAADKGKYRITAESWQTCTGQAYDGTCRSPGSYTCEYKHNERTPYAFEVVESCSSGACCDTSNNWLKPATEICAQDTGTEYRCTGASRGDNVEVRHSNRHCSGQSSSCDGSEAWGAWELHEDCPTTHYCDYKTYSCVQDPVECRTDYDCGTSGWAGNTFCSNSEVYQNYVTYTCQNPGTAQSECTSTTEVRKKGCEEGMECKNGSCETIYGDKCTNLNKYWCENSSLWHCGQNPDLGGVYDRLKVDNCIGNTDCWTSADSMEGTCLDKSMTIAFDYAPAGTSVYKEAGDKLKMMINAASATTADLNYDESAFEALGNCTKGPINLSAGANECNFRLAANAIPKTYFFTLKYNGNNTMRGVIVVNNPKMLIATNKEKLLERFSDNSGVNNLLTSTYIYARANKGVVYDLSGYSFKNEHPFQSFSSYNEKPGNLNTGSNAYTAEVASFLKQRCPSGACRHILILGDDFVIPHGRMQFNEFSLIKGRTVNTVLTDTPFIAKSTKAITDANEVFGEPHPIAIIIPDSISGEMRDAVNYLKSDLMAKYHVPHDELFEFRESQVNCMASALNQLTGKTVIIIGSQNLALDCVAWFDDTEIFSIKRSPWGRSLYYNNSVLVIRTDSPDMVVNTLSRIDPNNTFSWGTIKDSDGDGWSDEEETMMHTAIDDPNDNFCTRLPTIKELLAQTMNEDFWKGLLPGLTGTSQSQGDMKTQISTNSIWVTVAYPAGMVTGAFSGIMGGIRADIEFVVGIPQLIGTVITIVANPQSWIDAAQFANALVLSPLETNCKMAKTGQNLGDDLTLTYLNNVIPSLYYKAELSNPGRDLGWDDKDKQVFNDAYVVSFHAAFIFEQLLIGKGATKAAKSLKAGEFLKNATQVLKVTKLKLIAKYNNIEWTAKAQKGLEITLQRTGSGEVAEAALKEYEATATKAMLEHSAERTAEALAKPRIYQTEWVKFDRYDNYIEYLTDYGSTSGNFVADKKFVQDLINKGLNNKQIVGELEARLGLDSRTLSNSRKIVMIEFNDATQLGMKMPTEGGRYFIKDGKGVTIGGVTERVIDGELNLKQVAKAEVYTPT